ncbi:hypothetical protein ACFS5N_10300 [Mucilaginibacter ximonensis]|uniref:Uncharacterized protein n=1 Tax=Mucilaginibacter ximonensis TaxID=538021 RepID=A0ABW5YCG0_9SPHI
MKKRISFDPAWVILSLVVITLITMNFMDDEHTRNILAATVLTVCLLSIAISIMRSFGGEVQNEEL